MDIIASAGRESVMTQLRPDIVGYIFLPERKAPVITAVVWVPVVVMVRGIVHDKGMD